MLRLPAMTPPMIVRDVLLFAMPRVLLRHPDEPSDTGSDTEQVNLK